MTARWAPDAAAHLHSDALCACNRLMQALAADDLHSKRSELLKQADAGQ